MLARAAFSTALGSLSRLSRHSAIVQPARQVAVDRVMRRGLVGDDVRVHAALYQLRKHVCRVAEQADRLRLARLGPAVDHLQRLVERGRLLVEVAGAQRKSMRVSSHSTARQQAPAMTAASGCAPPMPPSPAVRIQRP
jgi:hypothetical protein